jgi:hypothetical protein
MRHPIQWTRSLPATSMTLAAALAVAAAVHADPPPAPPAAAPAAAASGPAGAATGPTSAPAGTLPASAPAASGPAATLPAVPRLTQLVVHPSAIARPALRYRLLPDSAERTPGNAAPLYQVAAKLIPEYKSIESLLHPEDRAFDYEMTPTDQFPPAAAAKAMAALAEPLRYADMAARRDYCRFGATVPDELSLGLAASQYYADADMRYLAVLLNFRGRLQVLHGDWPAAAETVRTVLAMSRHLQDEPSTGHAMFGSGFANIVVSGVVEDWVSHPGSPNLYWPLTALPQPFTLPPTTMGWDHVWMTHAVPLLDVATKGELGADQWPQLVRQMARFRYFVGEWGKPRAEQVPPPADLGPLTDALVAGARAEAERSLAADGLPADRLRAMSPEQLVGTYFVRQYAEWADVQSRTWTLPYPRAAEELDAAWAAFRRRYPRLADSPLVFIPADARQVPSALKVKEYLMEAERTLAVTRTIEALRDHAALHGGKPPARLEDIEGLPIPIDPMAGKPFSYRLEGGVVVLEGPPKWRGSIRSAIRYELTFVP